MKLTTYDNLKQRITHVVRVYHINTAAAPTGRPRKIPIITAVTLALYQHASTRATKRSLYEDFKTVLRCSYKTLVVSVNRTARLVAQILVLLMRSFAREAHPVKYTDATDLPVCLRKNGDSHRTMRGLRFDHPLANDRDIFRRINKNIRGVLVADAGYVSKKLEQEMTIENQRILLIRPYKSMKRLATFWQLAVYRGRFKIEFDFRVLKLFHGLVTSMPRSIDGYLANYLHALLSFVLA